MSTLFYLYGSMMAVLVAAGGILTLDAVDRTSISRVKNIGFILTLLGLGFALVFLPFDLPARLVFGKGMFVWDSLSLIVAAVALVSALLVTLMSFDFKAYENLRLAPYHALLLFSTAGVVFVALSNDFLMSLIAVELVSLPLAILAGYLKRDEKSKQAALKFFIISTCSAAFLVYGLSILYSILGSTSFEAIRNGVAALESHRTLSILAFLLILMGVGFKIAFVPFHGWVPDVFEGAPLPVSAFLSLAPKFAGAALAFRAFSFAFDGTGLGFLIVLAVVLALTMTIGNILGLQQTNVIRMMGYSSIAHMGYLLLGLMVGVGAGYESFFLYAIVYLFMNAGAFMTLMTVTESGGQRDISAFEGLSERSPVLAAALTLFLLSLAGIPPLAGFVAKFYTISTVYKAGWVWLAVVAIFNTLISAAYYFRILRAVYFCPPPPNVPPLFLPRSAKIVIMISALATISIGLLPNRIIQGCRKISDHVSLLGSKALDCCKPVSGSVEEAAPNPAGSSQNPATVEEGDHAPHEQ